LLGVPAHVLKSEYGDRRPAGERETCAPAGFDRRGRVDLHRNADLERIDLDWLGDVLERDGAKIADREVKPRSSERQMSPGMAMPSSRAAILTPSPIKSPSLSSTTSPM